jgi:hypothetical protein
MCKLLVNLFYIFFQNSLIARLFFFSIDVYLSYMFKYVEIILNHNLSWWKGMFSHPQGIAQTSARQCAKFKHKKQRRILHTENNDCYFKPIYNPFNNATFV